MPTQPLTPEQHRAALNEALEKAVERDCPPPLRAECLAAVRSTLPDREWSYVQHLIATELKAGKNATEIQVASEFILIAAYTKDDILDGTVSRYGLPTVASQQGPGVSALVSDTLFCAGIRGLLRTLPTQRATAAVDQVLSGYLHYSEGQLDQSASDPVRSATLRTGELVGALLRLPAELDSPDKAGTFQELGCSLGTCWQLLNDLLDVLGDAEKQGKPIMEDLARGRPNLVLDLHRNWALTRGADTDKDAILALYNAGRVITADQQIQLTECLRGSGALEGALEQYYAHLDAALDKSSAFLDHRVRNAYLQHIEQSTSSIQWPQ